MARLEVEIEVAPGDVGGEPHVIGTVRTGDGTETSFLGWVGLMALLQRALAASADAAT